MPIPRDYGKALLDNQICDSSARSCNNATNDSLENRIECVTLDHGPEVHAVDNVKEATSKGVHDTVVAHGRGSAQPYDLKPRLYGCELGIGSVLRI